MKIKKIKTKDDAAAFLDSLQPGKPFCFESRGESIEIGPETGGMFSLHKITKGGESAVYAKTDAIKMVLDLSSDINLLLDDPEQKEIAGNSCPSCKYLDHLTWWTFGPRKYEANSDRLTYEPRKKGGQ